MEFKKSQSGYSFISLLVTMIIISVLGTVATSNSLPTVWKSKENLVISSIVEQKNLVLASQKEGYLSLEKANDAGDGDSTEYLADLISQGYLSPLPLSVFKSPSNLTWTLSKSGSSSRNKRFYLTLSSTDPVDQEFIQSVFNKLNLVGPSIEI